MWIIRIIKIGIRIKIRIIIFHIAFFFFFFFFYPRINKPHIHNNIIGIPSFQNGLNDSFSSTSFYFKSKVIEGSYKGEICSLLLGHLFSKYAFLRLWHFFLAYWLSNQLNFSMEVHTYKIHVFNQAFFLLHYRNAYGHQTFQSGDILRGALTHKYAWHLNGVVLQGHMANKTHISTFSVVLTPH